MIHKSAALGYRQNSDIYADIRPAYHAKLMERFIATVDSRSVLVELGAGTGIFTSQLVEAGYSPIAIEPIAEMRARLVSKLLEINVRDGTAEDSGLATASVDVVVAAQAFHWFNYREALAEIRRILRSDGLLICVWNVRDESIQWVQDYENALNRYAGNTPRHRTLEWRRAIQDDTSFTLVDDWSLPNPKPTSQEGVVKRALSTSFIASLDSRHQQKVIENIREIVAPLGDSFDFPYRSEMQVWRKHAQ